MIVRPRESIRSAAGFQHLDPWRVVRQWPISNWDAHGEEVNRPRAERPGSAPRSSRRLEASPTAARNRRLGSGEQPAREDPGGPPEGSRRGGRGSEEAPARERRPSKGVALAFGTAGMPSRSSSSSRMMIRGVTTSASGCRSRGRCRCCGRGVLDSAGPSTGSARQELLRSSSRRPLDSAEQDRTAVGHGHQIVLTVLFVKFGELDRAVDRRGPAAEAAAADRRRDGDRVEARWATC